MKAALARPEEAFAGEGAQSGVEASGLDAPRRRESAPTGGVRPESSPRLGRRHFLAASLGSLVMAALPRTVSATGPTESEPAESDESAVHLVAPGDTVLDIGRAHGLAVQHLARVNGLVNPNILQVGQLHKLSDGASTVGLMLTTGNPTREAHKWLALASLAPLVGFGLTALFSLSPAGLAALLAFFAGTFLFLGASHLLPKAHEADPAPGVAVATLVGLGEDPQPAFSYPSG